MLVGVVTDGMLLFTCVCVCVCAHRAQRFELGLHHEVELAELAAAGVGGFDPLVEAALVDEAQAARAATRHYQRTVVLALTVADPAQGIVHAHLPLAS